MSDPIVARLKRACQDERDRFDVGMRVGLPKVVVDLSSLESLLARYAHKDMRIAELEGLLGMLGKQLKESRDRERALADRLHSRIAHLQIAIEAAPHAQGCACMPGLWEQFPENWDESTCDCWKREAMG